MKHCRKLLCMALCAAMLLGLTPVLSAAAETETVKPAITWSRTLELPYRSEDTQQQEKSLGGLFAGKKTDYETVTSKTTTSGTTSTTVYTGTFSWDFGDVSEALSTDASMTVWDYGTESQYADPATNVDGLGIVPNTSGGVSAATWNNRSYDEQTVTYYEGYTRHTVDYEKGQFDDGHTQSYTVRKFSGSFAWPEGYDFGTTGISLVSKNDANYTEIYDYVNADAELKAAFGGKKVIAVNDDMYVFVYKDGDAPTADNYMDYLAFWTGTAGKGVWSYKNSQPQDNQWGSTWPVTTPSTFGDAYAARAFMGVYPNMDEAKAGTSGRTQLSDELLAKMNQSDTWYSFADGSGISSVLQNKYSDVQAGDVFHIDIYCFDTDKVGGMDELELELTRAKPTDANVTVRYWLNAVGSLSDANYLGNSTMTGCEIGTEITLASGTDANQLNFKKAAAITANNNGDVSNGEQQELPFTVTENSENNIINVVYYPAGQKIVHLWAGNLTTEYTGSPFTVHDVTVKQAGCADISVADSETQTSATLNDTDDRGRPTGNTVVNITAVAVQTLPGIYTVNFNAVSLVQSRWNSLLSNYTVVQHPGTLTITYTPADVLRTYDFGVQNSYEGIFTDVELNADISSPVDYVTVDKETNTVTYTPQSVNTGETVMLTLTFDGGYAVTKNLTFIPDTNVLYEEGFASMGSGWSVDGIADGTVVSDNESTVYGYAEAYDFAGYSNGAAYKATLNLGTQKRASTSGAVTFDFTGTGFDLISECGTDTGMLVVGLKNNDENRNVKTYIVDTYFYGDDAVISGDGILDYQVPVVRCLDLPYGSYTVTVYGYITSTSGASTASRFSTAALYSAPSSASLTDSILNDLGIYDPGEVEVAFMDDNSILNGGTGSDAAVQTVSGGLKSFLSGLKNFFSSWNTTFAMNAAGTDGVSVYVDAFRVYGPLTDESDYAENEQGLKYASVYDYVLASGQDMEELFGYDAMAYIEYDAEMDIASVAEYKNQGPQNEVYLSEGNYIGFVLDGYTDGQTVMVSAKTVKGGAVLGNDNGLIEELSSTEMYYDATEFLDPLGDGSYALVIGNVGEGILSVSAVKLPVGVTPVSSAELGKLVTKNNEPEEPAPEYFTPETFEVRYNDTVKTGKITSINVKTSLEVDHIDVFSDAELTAPVKEGVTPNNTKAVGLGKANLYSFNAAVRIAEGDNYFYIVAYDAAGNPSAPITVFITGK